MKQNVIDRCQREHNPQYHRTLLHAPKNGITRAIDRLEVVKHPHIIKFPDWRLIEPAKIDLHKIDKDLLELAEHMLDIVVETNSLGIAANQVGVIYRMFVMRDINTNRFYKCFNPEILEQDGKTQVIEGCLSLPGKNYKVKRFKRVTVKYTNEHGLEHVEKLTRAMGNIFQHELDHINGILINKSGREMK